MGSKPEGGMDLKKNEKTKKMRSSGCGFHVTETKTLGGMMGGRKEERKRI